VATVAAVSAPELRPLSVGEIIDVALKIWRRHFATLARIVLVVVAPIEILSLLIINSVMPDSSQRLEAGDVVAFSLGALTSLGLGLLAFLLASAATLRAVSIAYLGGQPDWRESLRAAVSRFRSLLWLFVLSGLGLTLALLLVVPFFWLAVSWSLAFVVLVAEGVGGTAALARSYQLVKDRWWPTLGALALGLLVQTLMRAVIAIPLGIVSFNSEEGSAAALVSSAMGDIISAVVTTSFFSAVLVLIYYDLRVRKEGFDLALMAQNIGVADAGPPAWPSPGPPSTPPSGPPTVPPPSPPTRPPSSPPTGPPSWPSPDPSWRPPGSS
jgi:predicted secreted protein